MLILSDPIYANAIIIVTAIAGILSLSLMPKSFFPELPPNKIYVSVAYPGASPTEIEEGITTRVEQSLNGIRRVLKKLHLRLQKIYAELL